MEEERSGGGEQDTRVLLSRSRCHLRLSGGARGVKEGQERRGGRASADLEGLSGTWEVGL